MKRLTLCLAVLLALWLPARGAAGPTVVTFWHAMRGARGVALDHLIAKFNALNPEVRVEARFVGSNQPYGNDYQALYQTVLQSLAQHQPPDVAQVYENWTVQLLQVHAIAPIQPFLNPQEVDDLVPVFRQANTFDGTLYTMPFNKSIYVLYYNPRLVPHPPRTWQEVRDTARQVTAAHHGIYGLAFQPGVDIFGDLLFAGGGDFFDAQNRPAFSGPAGVAALQTLQDMAIRDRSAVAAQDAERWFTSGRAAMFIYSSTAQVDMAPQATFRVAPLPSGSATAYQFAGTNLAILAPAARQAAAARLIRFLTNLPNTVAFATQTGYLPVQQAALQNREYQAFLQLHPGFRVGLDALPYARIQPRVAAWEGVRGILDDAVYAALAKGANVSDILHRAADQANRLVTGESL